MKRVFAVYICFFCASCAHVDVGQADYRVAEPAFPPVCSKAAKCPPSSPASLERKYLPGVQASQAPFGKQEVFSIDLEQMVIGPRLLEGQFFGRDIGVALGDTAEIAILANVFEFSKATSAENVRGFLNGSTDMITGAEGASAMKLIYYSDDVRPSQALNFDNIPIHPRATYGGGSVGIQIVVLEVDSRSQAVGSLLSTLADFGKGALPTLPGGADVLINLGKSLFAGGSSDDRLFDYRFVLSYGGHGGEFPQAEFAPGRYVVLRQQDRRTPIDWSEFQIDHNNGRLYRKPGGAEVRDRLYMTIGIKKFPTGTDPEGFNQMAWSAFRTALAEAGTGDEAIESLQSDLRTILVERGSATWANRLVDSWNEAERSLQNFQQLYLPDDAIKGVSCGVTPAVIAGNRDRAERAAIMKLREFVALYRQALATVPATVPASDASESDSSATAAPTSQGATKPAEQFRLAHRESLVSHVSTYFTPWQEDDRALFADAAAFERNFVTADDPAKLSSRAVAVAVSRLLPGTTCGDLAARGIIPRGSW